MDYSGSPSGWNLPSHSRTPAELAAAFGGPCYAFSPPKGGEITGAHWMDDAGILDEIQVHQELTGGGRAVILTTRNTTELLTLMANLYASHIDLDGPGPERISRAAAFHAGPSSVCRLEVDGTTQLGVVIADHAAVVLGCTLPDRSVIAFLAGNPLPRPTILCRVPRQPTA